MTTACTIVALVISCLSSNGAPPTERPSPTQAMAVFLTSHPAPETPAPLVVPAGWTHVASIEGTTFAHFFPYADAWPLARWQRHRNDYGRVNSVVYAYDYDRRDPLPRWGRERHAERQQASRGRYARR